MPQTLESANNIHDSWTTSSLPGQANRRVRAGKSTKTCIHDPTSIAHHHGCALCAVSKPAKPWRALRRFRQACVCVKNCAEPCLLDWEATSVSGRVSALRWRPWERRGECSGTCSVLILAWESVGGGVYFSVITIHFSRVGWKSGDEGL